MSHIMDFKPLTVLFMGLCLAGCSVNGLPTTRCADRLMLKPAPVANIKAGDDVIEKYADLRAASGRDKGQIRGLQSCVTAIYGK